MLDGQAGGAVLADKAYDANTLRVAIGAEAVNPVEPIPQDRHPHNADLWGYRHRIKRDVNRLKHFSRFATRYGANHSLPRLRSPRHPDDMDRLMVDPP